MAQPVESQETRFSADVSAQRIARVYAEALLGAAEAKGAAEQVRDEFHALVHDAFARDPQIEEFFSSAAISRDRKSDLLDRAFEGRASETFVDFLRVVNRHDRLALLRTMEAEYRRLCDERARRIRVQVTSAIPLAEEQRQRIAQQVRATLQWEPILEEKVDPELLGGLVVRVGDWLFDGSVRNRIDQLRHQIITRSSHEIQSRRDRFSHPNGD